jgi:hypothetical protein
LQGDGHGDSLAPLDLLLVLQDSSSGCAGPAGQPMRAGQPMPAQDSSSGGGGLRGVLAYSPDVLEPHMMDLLAEHFQVCVASETGSQTLACCTKQQAYCLVGSCGIHAWHCQRLCWVPGLCPGNLRCAAAGPAAPVAYATCTVKPAQTSN